MGRTPDPIAVNSLHFAMSDETRQLAMATLFPPRRSEDDPWERGLLGILLPSTGPGRTTLILQRIVEQKQGWVAETEEGLFFSPRYVGRALDVAAELSPKAGLVVVHSHPADSGHPDVPPVASQYDLEAEVRMLSELAQILPEAAKVAAAIAGPSGSWRLRSYSFARATSEEELVRASQGPRPLSYVDAEITRVVGANGVRVLDQRRVGAAPGLTERAQESTAQIWGNPAQRELRWRTIGIAGLGGLGSLVAEYLALVGVGRLALVDYDVVGIENLNRMVGVSREDVGLPKVHCVARHCKVVATSPAFEVRAHRASVSEEEGIRALLASDLIIAAADPPHARQVLNHAAYAHLIPVIDGGSTIERSRYEGGTGGKCQITDAGPGRPCLECSGVYNRNEVTEWLEDPHFRGRMRYVTSAMGEQAAESARAPSVVALNALVASQAVMRAVDKMLRLFPLRPETQQRYYVGLGTMEWGPARGCDSNCPRARTVGLGDAHEIPVAVDPDWAALRGRESARHR